MNTTPIIEAIMNDFADRTGLTEPGRVPVRYLWTDAFAVCNFLELFHRTDDKRYLQKALDLVDQVHNVLGRHREDDPRQGWISGLSEAEGRLYPTRGGLRIGKRLPERKCDEPFDERMEWDRDGQYFHYLTKWMHALDRVARVTSDTTYIRWARELAESAHAAFVHRPGEGERKRMVWKMSIDLSYPLVPSMGHHDSLDGLITCQQVQATATDLGLPQGEGDLGAEIVDMAAMCEGVSWQTADALGVGGLLIDACVLAQLAAGSNLPESDRLEFLVDEAEVSLDALAQSGQMDAPVGYRLAFRELGLSIGLRGVEQIQAMLLRHPESFPNRQIMVDKFSRISPFLRWIDGIEAFWLEPGNQRSENWKAHEDINSVMLATSLGPDGFLNSVDPAFQPRTET